MEMSHHSGTFLSWKKILPLSGLQSPFIILRRVVLPQPERPVIEIISPLCAEKLR